MKTPNDNDTPHPGVLFMDAQTMRVVRAHEKFADTWWCEGVDDEVGEWAYSTEYILRNTDK